MKRQYKIKIKFKNSNKGSHNRRSSPISINEGKSKLMTHFFDEKNKKIGLKIF